MKHSLPRKYTKKKHKLFTRTKFFLEGDAGFIVILGVAIVAFLLGGGIASFYNQNYGVQGNLITPVPGYSAHNTNQLHTLNFMTVTPTPLPASISPTPPGATGSSVAECGYTIAGKHECAILYSYRLEAGGVGGSGLNLKLFYGDEHTMPLGQGSGVSVMASHPVDHISSPTVGDPSLRDGNKFPYFPAVFLTDITTNPPDKSGDAQNNGIPIPPDEVYGAWKAMQDNDPNSPNGKNLGSGADSFPSFTGRTCGDDAAETVWTGEVIWHVASLKYQNQPLQTGHTYRVQFSLHDGDDIGDVSDGCVTIKL